MRDLYKLFDKLTAKEISFCFQSQSKSHFFNLSVRDRFKKEHNIHSEDLNVIEMNLKVLWGHLLEEREAPSLPTPPGFPAP